MKFLQILVLIFGLFIVVNGQKTVLSGTVTDRWGAILPSISIKATDVEGKVVLVRTNDEGFYQLELIEGKYSIEILSPPFDKFSVSNYWIIHKMQLDVALQCKDCEIIDHNLVPEPTQTIQTNETKVSNQVLQRPLEKSPKEQNKGKRKNKN